MEKTQIKVWGVKILEPVTLITNLAVAAGCLFFSYKLHVLQSDNSMLFYWKMFFFVLGLSFIAGGIAHGFHYLFGKRLHLLVWIISGLSVLFAELSSSLLIEDPISKRSLQILVLVQFAAYAFTVLKFKKFVSVIINSIIGLFTIVFVIQLVFYIENQSIGSGLIALGVVLNFVPAVLHMKKIAINKWFNHNDVSHIVMLCCLYVIFLGSMQADLLLN